MLLYSTLQVYQRSYSQVGHIPPKMFDKFESQHSLSPTIWSDIVVGHESVPGANMVQGRNTLGYLCTRTFYIPERKYAYKYASITKCLTCSPREMQKKSLKSI
jgi:hypothetical protein